MQLIVVENNLREGLEAEDWYARAEWGHQGFLGGGMFVGARMHLL